MSMTPDVDCYRRFLQGDNSGLEELVQRYNDRLIAFLTGYVGQIAIAEDLAADTFVELLAKKPHYRESGSFQTWLFRIGRNNAIDYLRHRSRRKTIGLEDMEQELSDRLLLEDRLCENEEKEALYRAIKQLSPDYQAVLYLLYFEDMRYSEIGTILRKNEAQIKNLAYRARQSLKNALKKEDFFHADLY